MNNIGRASETNSVSLEGLDKVFDRVSPVDAEWDAPDDTMSSPAKGVQTTDDIASSDKYVLAAEAAAILKKSERTIQRWASSNKIKHRIDESGRLLVVVPTTADVQIVLGDTATPVADSASASVEKLATLVTSLTEDLLKAKDQLSAASGQIGYLKSQLEERQKDLEESKEQIKALTDRSSEKKLFERFYSWFIGRR